MSTKSVPRGSGEITLRRWRIIEVEAANGKRSRHVWGHDVTNALGRASSAIVQFDREAMLATTRSGTNYRLVGLPGHSRLGEYAGDKWCSDHGVTSRSDVTQDYMDIGHLSTVELTRINFRQGE